MGLAWKMAGVGACHPTSLFGRLGLSCWSGLGWADLCSLSSLIIHGVSDIIPSTRSSHLSPSKLLERTYVRHLLHMFGILNTELRRL